MSDTNKLSPELKMQFSTPEAAARHGVKPATLRAWRLSGDGPRFRRISRNFVVYDKADLDAFFLDDERCPRYRSTSEG